MSRPPTAPARPGRRRRKEARPGEILAAGLQEFSSRGFAATRLEDVARRAGVSKATIYLYFRDKEALFLAIIEALIAPTLTEVGESIGSFEGSTRDLLALAITAAHRRIAHSDLRLLLRILIVESAKYPQLAERYHRMVIQRGRRLMAAIVERGIARGEVRPGPAADLPIVIMAPALMSALWQMVFQPHAPVDPEAFLAAHVDLVCNGLLTEPGRAV